jgi:hypothetical protein
MPLKALFKNWWVILLQGIFMIALSIIIFNNPGAVLTAVALWLGVVVIITGLIGVIAWVSTKSSERENMYLVGSIAIIVIGILMVTRVVATIKAITVVFGLMVAVVGLFLIGAGWQARRQWSSWWLVLLFGIVILFMGLKGLYDMYSGMQQVSNFTGIAVLVGGIGLIMLALVKRGLMKAIRG